MNICMYVCMYECTHVYVYMFVFVCVYVFLCWHRIHSCLGFWICQRRRFAKECFPGSPETTPQALRRVLLQTVNLDLETASRKLALAG